jgi:hypothetical protein
MIWEMRLQPLGNRIFGTENQRGARPGSSEGLNIQIIVTILMTRAPIGWMLFVL